MSNGVDYSKWDKLEAEEDDARPGRPVVTRLDRPSSVTLGPGGASVVEARAPEPVRGFPISAVASL